MRSEAASPHLEENAGKTAWVLVRGCGLWRGWGGGGAVPQFWRPVFLPRRGAPHMHFFFFWCIL